jgi:4-hydroxyphenylacetate 3-monooxygenase
LNGGVFLPAINGQGFMNRIHQLQPEIWLEGKKITDICNHEAFKGILTSKAELFDLQMNKDHKDLMTYVSPVSGERVGTSFMQPKTKEDLEKRRLSTQAWAKLSGGMMGRSPDYMNSCLMALGTAWDHFQDSRLIGKHILQMYERARENDLTLAHTFVNPQVNRSMLYFEDEEHPISAKVVKETSDGIIIKGARLLATQGGITDELLVLPIGGKYIGESFIYAFSIPSNTPNLRFICRESFRYRSSAFDHPLGARFEEMDTIVVFDDVLVPWERVFLYNDYSISMQLASETSYFTFLLHQATARQVVKTEFLLGLAQLIVDSIDIGSYTHVQGKVSEIISALETLKALLLSSEMNAKLDKRGRMVPDVNPLSAAITTFPRLYPRFIEILETLGASGLISIPTEKDFESPIRGDLDHYLQGASCEAKERTQLFRLAWDVCLSAFGGRQKQYERFFFGDPVRLESGLYNSYSKESAVNLAKSLLNSNLKKE